MGGSPPFAEHIRLAHRLRLDDVITAEFPLEQAPEAFEEKNTRKHAKVVIHNV